MKKILSTAILLLIPVLFMLFISFKVQAEDEAALKKRLSYLNDIPEISWVEFDKNNVYIGFNTRPSDLKLIMSAAAYHGNIAYGFGVHVWAVHAKHKGWRPGDSPYYCNATARHGKVTKNNCK